MRSGPDTKNRLTNRQRSTLAALVSMLAVPFVFHNARLAFQPFINEGGSAANMAWFGLFAIYYVMVRTALDLYRDCSDFLSSKYRVAGDGHHRIDQRRKSTPPYDLLLVPEVKRDFSKWQFTMITWMFFEVILGWISTAAVLYASLRSPYLTQTGHATSQHTLSWFILKMSFFLVGLAQYSIAYRWDLGLTPIVQRLLGLPDTYPGQNRFPRWVNEFSIRLFGRPM